MPGSLGRIPRHIESDRRRLVGRPEAGIEKLHVTTAGDRNNIRYSWGFRVRHGLAAVRVIGSIGLLAFVVGCQTGPDVGHGEFTTYSVILRHFSDHEAITIMRAMREDFPGYQTHNLVSKTVDARRYEYSTTAKAFKLEEWLYGLLRDLGFDTSSDTLVEVEGIRITVDKLTSKQPLPLPPAEPPQELEPPEQDKDNGEWEPVTG